MTEEWRDIPGYGGLYAASSLGRIKAKARTVIKRTRWGTVMSQSYRERILRGSTLKGGYLGVHLGVDGEKYGIGAHRLVALAFHGPCPDGLECRHLNGIGSDNRPENLAWGTHLENNRDRHRHGNYPTGTDHPMAKHSPELLAEIQAGKLTVREAESRGVSRTHYYRTKKRVPA